MVKNVHGGSVVGPSWQAIQLIRVAVKVEQLYIQFLALGGTVDRLEDFVEMAQQFEGGRLGVVSAARELVWQQREGRNEVTYKDNISCKI